jgi:hypothetical protein
MSAPASTRSATRTATIAMLTLLLYGCPPVPIKLVDLAPVNLATGTSGVAGAEGYCLSGGSVPPVAFSPGPGQVLVGFDDFFQPGAQPFPCDHLRDANFRAGVQFDLSKFSKVGIATLTFDTVDFVARANGETTGSSPPTSVATTLGVGTQAFSAAFPDTDEVSLPGGPTVSVGVGNQVSNWVTSPGSNFGFVISGPRASIDPNNPPKDNDARVSFYANFRLTVTYNPVLNPNAPQ